MLDLVDLFAKVDIIANNGYIHEKGDSRVKIYQVRYSNELNFHESVATIWPFSRGGGGIREKRSPLSQKEVGQLIIEKEAIYLTRVANFSTRKSSYSTKVGKLTIPIWFVCHLPMVCHTLHEGLLAAPPYLARIGLLL
jgi:hypothetical protein